MITDPVRARLVPVDEEDEPIEADALEFDFNPESLSLRVAASVTSSDKGGLGNTEATGRASGTLSFDAVFDATRPSTSSSGTGGDPSAGISAGVSVEAGASASVGASASASIGVGGSAPPTDDSDVRSRTGRIARWVTGDPSESHPTPQRVQFQWGNIAYTGVIESFSETIDYFAPDGTALRSKVSLSLREAALSQQVSAADRQSLALSAGFGVGASLSLDFSASVGLGLSAGLELGAGVDLGFSASAGLDLSADASLGVFGGAAASAALGAEVDISSSAAATAASEVAASVPPTPTPWAPGAPPAHTAAASLAGLVQEQRAAGAALSLPDPSEGALIATNLSGASSRTPGAATVRSVDDLEPPPLAGRTVVPVPIRGAPPRRVPVSPVPRPVARAHDVPPPRRPSATRPSWEVLPPDDPTVDPDHRGCDCDGRPLCR